MKWLKIIILLIVQIEALPGINAHNHAFQGKKEAITKAFKIAFGAPLPRKFQPLTGGFSSPGVYKVIINGKPYVIRLSHPKRTIKDEERTIICMKISAERGLSPKIYYSCAKDGIVIMDYIEPKLLTWEELTNRDNLQKLAIVLQKLHEGPVFPEFCSVFNVRKMFERSLGSHKPELFKELSDYLEKIEVVLQDTKLERPCHNDLKVDNIIFDGQKFWLVDWEAGSQGNSFFDIATVITFLAMTPNQEEFFLEVYFKRKPTLIEHSQLNLMKQVVLSYYGTAFLMIAKNQHILPLNSKHISTLPSANVFLKNHIKNPSFERHSKNVQEFGMILLNQAIKNIHDK